MFFYKNSSEKMSSCSPNLKLFVDSRLELSVLRVFILNYLQPEFAEISWELDSKGLILRSYEKRSIED